MVTRKPQWSEVSEKLARDIVTALVLEKWPLVITGPVGTGKSCAMACLYRSFWMPKESHKPILWYDSGKLLADITSCRTNKTGFISIINRDGSTTEISENGFYRKIENAALLCLDDVGVREASPTQREIFNRIIDLRADKPTIITTNLNHQKFKEAFDDRSFSRVFSGPVVLADGDDKRFGWLAKLKGTVATIAGIGKSKAGENT